MRVSADGARHAAAEAGAASCGRSVLPACTALLWCTCPYSWSLPFHAVPPHAAPPSPRVQDQPATHHTTPPPGTRGEPAGPGPASTLASARAEAERVVRLAERLSSRPHAWTHVPDLRNLYAPMRGLESFPAHVSPSATHSRHLGVFRKGFKMAACLQEQFEKVRPWMLMGAANR